MSSRIAALWTVCSDKALATTQTAWQERTVTIHNLEAETYIIEVKEIGIEKRDALDIDSLKVTVSNAPDTTDMIFNSSTSS
jgi:hypothetical protein